MIGEAQNDLGKAATSEGHKEPHEQEPGQEIEKLEQENETRVESLQGKTGHRAATEFTVKFLLFLRRPNHLPGPWPGSPKVSFAQNHLDQYLLLKVDFPLMFFQQCDFLPGLKRLESISAFADCTSDDKSIFKIASTKDKKLDDVKSLPWRNSNQTSTRKPSSQAYHHRASIT